MSCLCRLLFWRLWLLFFRSNWLITSPTSSRQILHRDPVATASLQHSSYFRRLKKWNNTDRATELTCNLSSKMSWERFAGKSLVFLAVDQLNQYNKRLTVLRLGLIFIIWWFWWKKMYLPVWWKAVWGFLTKLKICLHLIIQVLRPLHTRCIFLVWIIRMRKKIQLLTGHE